MTDTPAPSPVRLPAEAARFLQRARILDATVRSVAEAGYALCSVERIAGRAGISKRTFYDRYDGKEAAVAAAYGAATDLATAEFEAALAGDEDWPAAVVAAIGVYVSLLECDAEWAWFCVVEAPGAGAAVAERRDRLARRILAALRRHPGAAVDGPVGSRVVLEAVDGAVRDWLLRRREGGDGDPGFRGQLALLALAPSLGISGAGVVARRAAAGPRELGRRTVEAAHVAELDRAIARLPDAVAIEEVERIVHRGVVAGEGLVLWRAVAGLQRVREPRVMAARRGAAAGLADASVVGLALLTGPAAGAAEPPSLGRGSQRDRCLAYIAAHPGASGQDLRRALGFRHPSQVTRLLAALEADGLIGTPRPRAERANAWRITARGQAALGAA